MRAIDANCLKFAFISRFTPIPWGMQNCLYAVRYAQFHIVLIVSLTVCFRFCVSLVVQVSVLPLWQFAMATFLGGLPDQALIVYLGTKASAISGIDD